MNLLRPSSRLGLWIATVTAAPRVAHPLGLRGWPHASSAAVLSPSVRRVHPNTGPVSSPARGGWRQAPCGRCRLFSSPPSSSPAKEEEDGGRPDVGGRKRVVFLGTPEVASLALRRLHQDSVGGGTGTPYDIVCVITQPPKRRRRGGTAEEASPVGKAAEELGLPVLAPERAGDKDFLDLFETDVRPDLCVTAAYGQYLPRRFLATPTLGTVNIHPSLLPRWRGASPVQRSLEAGDDPVGVTVLFTVSKMDAGPIIARQEEAVGEDETATEVLPRLFEVGTSLLIECMPGLLSGWITMETAEPQDEARVVPAAMIGPAEAELRPWEETATAMHNRLRGFSMWPGVFLYLEVGEGTGPTKYKILETRVAKGDDDGAEPTDRVVPGPTKKDGLRLVCFDGSVLEIMRLQPATKKPVDALSFVNGLQGRTVRYVRTPEAVATTA